MIGISQTVRGEGRNMTDNRQWGPWIDWFGGNEPPIPDGVEFQVIFRLGSKGRDTEASEWRWDHRGGSGDIIAYRVLAEQAAQSPPATITINGVRYVPETEVITLRERLDAIRIAVEGAP